MKKLIGLFIIAIMLVSCTQEEEEVGCGCELVTYKRDKLADRFSETDREPTDSCEKGIVVNANYVRKIIQCN